MRRFELLPLGIADNVQPEQTGGVETRLPVRGVAGAAGLWQSGARAGSLGVHGMLGVRRLNELIMLMRILLQQKETGLYFKDIGAWSREPAEAMDFLSSTSAIDFCALNRISGVQLVLKFEEQRYDIVLPVAPDKAPRAGESRPSV